MSSYVPAKLFKFVRPSMMKAVFEKCGVPFPAVDYERIGFKTSILANAWKEQKMQRNGGRNLAVLDATMQDISDVGTAKTNMEDVITELIEAKNIRMEPGFEKLNVWEKAVSLYLYEDGGEIWHELLATREVRECNHTKRWYEFSGFENCDLDALEAKKDTIATIVKNYFEDRKKCDKCTVEIYRKSPTLCYIYAELDDSIVYDEQKRPGESDFEVCPIVHPFRIVLSCDTETGIFAISVQDSKQNAEDLAKELIYDACDIRQGVNRAGRFHYDLARFLGHCHEMVLAPGDGVARFIVNSITVAPVLRKKTTYSFSGEHGIEAIEEAKKYISCGKYANMPFTVRKVKLTLVLSRRGLVKDTISFTIDHDDCNLRNLPDSLREIGEKLLDRWEVRYSA